jgi:hypothetical protein
MAPFLRSKQSPRAPRRRPRRPRRDPVARQPAGGRRAARDERAIERYLQRALDPPGELVDRPGEIGDASSAPSSPQPATHGTVSPLTSSYENYRRQVGWRRDRTAAHWALERGHCCPRGTALVSPAPPGRLLGTRCERRPAHDLSRPASASATRQQRRAAARIHATQRSCAQPSAPSGYKSLHVLKGGSLRSPPAPAAGGRKRPSSPARGHDAHHRPTSHLLRYDGAQSRALRRALKPARRRRPGRPPCRRWSEACSPHRATPFA